MVEMETLWRMTLQASVLIVVVMAIRAVFLHRLPKGTFGVLWGVVALRLLVPASFSSPFSAYTWLGGAIGREPDSPVRQLGQMTRAAETVRQGAAKGGWIGWVWLVPATALAVWFVAGHWRCRREYAASLPLQGEWICQWQKEHPLRRRMRVRQSDRTLEPFSYGILRPVIMLPKEMEGLGQEQLNYVLAHEYMHIRHWDIARKWALALAVCVHWFNPLVWAMYILANRDMELSCDEAALCALGEGKRSDYALTLLAVAEKRSGLMAAGNGFCGNSMEERIQAIMKMKKITKISLSLAAFLVVGTTTVFATSAETAEDRLAVKEEEVNDAAATANAEEEGEEVVGQEEVRLAIKEDDADDAAATANAEEEGEAVVEQEEVRLAIKEDDVDDAGPTAIAEEEGEEVVEQEEVRLAVKEDDVDDAGPTAIAEEEGEAVLEQEEDRIAVKE